MTDEAPGLPTQEKPLIGAAASAHKRPKFLNCEQRERLTPVSGLFDCR